jgi:hypothetical protein
MSHRQKFHKKHGYTIIDFDGFCILKDGVYTRVCGDTLKEAADLIDIMILIEKEMNT